MQNCHKCSTSLRASDKFCFQCGSPKEVRCPCGAQLQSHFIFCATCGKRTGTTTPAQTATTCSTSDGVTVSEPSISPRQDLVTDVKKRLQMLRDKQDKQDKQCSSFGNPSKKVKRELVVHAGIKDWRTMKLKKKFGGMKKLVLDRHLSYRPCIEKICNSFEIKSQEQMYLVDNGNKLILEENFTVENYVKNYNYVGATRMYLVVDLDDCCCSNGPPNLTPQKKCLDSTVQAAAATTKTTVQQSDLEATETTVQQSDLEAAETTAQQSDLDAVKTTVQQSDLEAAETTAQQSDLDATKTTVQQSDLEVDQTDQCRDTSSSCSNILSSSNIDIDFSKAITFDEVTEYMYAHIMENGDQLDTAPLSDPGFTPFYRKNVSVMYFADKMKKEGKNLEVISSAFGNFVLIPDKYLDDYFKIRETLDCTDLLYLNKPLVYFLKITKIDPINMQFVSDNVVKFDAKLCEEYKNWYANIKQSIADTMGI